MNDLLENTYSWTGSFVESFLTLVYDVANLVVASFTITSNTSNSPSDSDISGHIASTSVVSGEKVLSNIPQAIQEAVSLFAFDDFQYLLLKIFVTILISNIFFIYIAWYIYGDRITERFMTPSKLVIFYLKS